MAPTKTATFLLGSSYSSPATVAHGGTPVYSSSFNMSTFFKAIIAIWITTASVAPTRCLWQPQVSDDGTNWTDDGPQLLIGDYASTVYSGTYRAPDSALYVRVAFVNLDTTNDVTALAVAMAITTEA
jgi:hypothetical protein